MDLPGVWEAQDAMLAAAPGDPRPLADAAFQASRLGAHDRAEALATALAGMEEEEGGEMVWIVRGRVRLAAGRPLDALDDFTRAHRLAPGWETAVYWRAVALGEGGRHEEVVAWVSSLLGEAPSWSRRGAAAILYRLGLSAEALSDRDTASEAFRRAALLDPRHPLYEEASRRLPPPAQEPREAPAPGEEGVR